MGVQEEEARPRCRDGAARPICRGVGKSAAAGRLRHRSLPHRDALDQRGSRKYEIELDDLAEPDKLGILARCSSTPISCAPGETRAGLTKKAADKFQTISDRFSTAVPTRGDGAFRQSAGVLLLRRQREAAAERPMVKLLESVRASRRAARNGSISYSPPWKRAANSTSTTSLGSTAACSTAGRRFRSNTPKASNCCSPRRAGLEPDRPQHLRHAVRAVSRSGKARADRRPLHRPRKDHDDRGAGDHAAASGANGPRPRRKSRDHGAGAGGSSGGDKTPSAKARKATEPR